MKTTSITLFVIVLFHLVSLNCKSQEIKDDTIYVSAKQQATLYFPEKISACDFSEEAAFNRFTKRVETSMVSILAKTKDPQPTLLKVIEGKRNHRFVLVYKEELTAEEQDHDWEKLKDLETYVRSLSNKKAVKKDAPIVKVDKPSDVIPRPVAPKKNPIVTPETYNSESYDEIIRKAFSLFTGQKYEEAKDEYEKAIKLKPDDKIAAYKIEEINRILDEKQKNQEYATKVAAADRAFSTQNFEEARGLYLIVLSIKRDDAYATRRLSEIEKKIENIKLTNQTKENEQNFQKSIITGKKALQEKKYEEARAAFTLALKAKPADLFCLEQVKFIDKLLKDYDQEQAAVRMKQEQEERYNNSLTIANDAFNNGQLRAAQLEYKKILLIKNDPFVVDQLKTIDKMIADSAKQAFTAQALIEKEKQNNELYIKLKEKGDAAFELKKYADAKLSYTKALNYKDDRYARQKISEIEDIETRVAEAEKQQKKYNALVLKAKAAVSNGDIDKAKIYLEEAVTLNSSDGVAKEQLISIYEQLQNLAKAKELADRYDSCISRAEVAIIKKDYKKAQDLWKEAGELKPSEHAPTRMIIYLEGLLLQETEQKEREQLAKKRRKIITLKENVSKSIFDKDWKEALSIFEEILTLNPTKPDQEFAVQKIDAIRKEIAKMDSIDALKAPVVITVQPTKRTKAEIKRAAVIQQQRDKQDRERLAVINEQEKNLDKKKEALVFKTDKEVIPIPDNSNDNYVQTESIPYSHSDLLIKYPAINFDEMPAGQSYDLSDRKNRSQNFEISNKLIAEKSNLNVSDSNNSIKIVCQNIAFTGTNSYIKFIIRNNSSTDFLTGSIQLKLLRQNGSTANLDQRFISSFPIVMPNKEFPIIYVTNTVDIKANDKLVLEVTDRTRKTKLMVNIPGEIYNVNKTVKL